MAKSKGKKGKKEDKFKEMGLQVPEYDARFTKAFPHLDPHSDEELIEVEDENDEGEIFDAGGYRSEKEIDEDLNKAEEEVEDEKGGFFRWLLGKEKHHEPERKKQPVELARVSALRHKKHKKEEATIKETDEGTVIMQPREDMVVKREKAEVQTGFEVPEEVLHAHHTEKKIKQAKKIKLPKEKKQAIVHHIKKHKPKTYTKPYADYGSLKDELKHLNKKLTALR